jgi:crotonobetainyl-CoA:carnitine CoA-transferase CaiB-like acyl-CoA transferase
LRLRTTDGLPIACGPQRVGVAIADLMTGMYSTVGILGVLRGNKIL